MVNYPVDTTNSSGSGAELPAEAEAGTPSIEVTPAMIEAGVEVLWESGAIEHPLEADREVVRRVYLAMHGAARS